MSHEATFQPNPELFPFRSRWFQSRAGRVHYIDEGEGPVVLLLHGNPTWSFLYRDVVVRLRTSFRCVAPDYLGFGLSEHPTSFGYSAKEQAEVVRQLVRYLDLQGVTIVGHDWGGPIGMRIALDETPRVRALVMGNTWYWPTDGFLMKAFAYAMSTGPAQKLILERNFFAERLLRAGVKRSMPDAVLEHYARVFPSVESRSGVAELARDLTSSDFWLGEIAHAVPRILRDVPLLLTWGMHDPVFTPRFMDHFREDFRSVRVRRLDARHFIQEDTPVKLSEAVEGFLRPTPSNGSR